ncbi:MAG: hypothetical protein ACM3SS_11080 [Rhodospirillaceae bacterium]
MQEYERIESVIRYLDTHHAAQPDLATLARHAGPSAFHFHRMFSAWVGVTLEAATPGEMKSGGAGQMIAYGYAARPFGVA